MHSWRYFISDTAHQLLSKSVLVADQYLRQHVLDCRIGGYGRNKSDASATILQGSPFAKMNSVLFLQMAWENAAALACVRVRDGCFVRVDEQCSFAVWHLNVRKIGPIEVGGCLRKP